MLWWENKHIFWIKWDGNIQNVLFCSGRKCRRTSLDNTRHASTSDSHSFTSPEVFPCLCCFQGTSRYKFLEYYARKFKWFSINCTLCLRQKKRTQVLFVFFILSLFFSRRPPSEHAVPARVYGFQFLPNCTGRPTHAEWRCSCLAAVQKLFSEKTLSVSRTVGHLATLCLLYCCIAAMCFFLLGFHNSAMTFSTNISQNVLLDKSVVEWKTLWFDLS